ncbi:MAG: N-acetyl-gamma-glutamyl-phosphate reductase [Candidatus Hydrogenedentes bacterium]|nr:N-acetyl-gamma-glutamyl-phosphate reductase [Candidatus Hydrogenedentota bacterium]
MIRAGLVGTTGYGARELVQLLLGHPGVELCAAVSSSAAGQPLGEVLPAFRKLSDLKLEEFDPARLAQSCDVVFVGVPEKAAMGMVAQLREAGARVIDIGPDFRLKDPAVYKTYYKEEHHAPALLEESVYGLVAQNRAALKDAQLVAVPGCYPISVLTPLLPLLDAPLGTVPVVINATSGISGAGRTPSEGFHFPEMNENYKAYKVAVHQHTPEMEQVLGHRLLLQFTPHVAPYTRGILSTIVIRPETLFDPAPYYARYENEPFIRVLGEGSLPEVKYVRSSTFCDFGWVRDARTGNLIIVSAIDNLVGGTAGMAVQCMNLMFGLDERQGLLRGGMAP